MYVYVENNPINSSDPLGLESWGFMQAYGYLHNQGLASSQPGYSPPKSQATEVNRNVTTIGKMVIDNTAQRAAEELAYRYVGTVVGAIIRFGNFLLTVVPLDINPQPAGDYPTDMYPPENITPIESPVKLPLEKTQCEKQI